MNTHTDTPTIARYDDAEGDGSCTECGREGLRWIAVLSNGATVGRECALKVTGRKPLAPKALSWLGAFELVAERTDCGEVYALYQHRGGVQTRETVNGHLTSVGGARQDWQRRGWLPA